MCNENSSTLPQRRFFNDGGAVTSHSLYWLLRVLDSLQSSSELQVLHGRNKRCSVWVQMKLQWERSLPAACPSETSVNLQLWHHICCTCVHSTHGKPHTYECWRRRRLINRHESEYFSRILAVQTACRCIAATFSHNSALQKQPNTNRL